MRWHNTFISALVLSMGSVGAASAQSSNADLSGLVMFGVNRDNGSLSRFDFDMQRRTPIGTIYDESGSAVLGVDGGAYIPGFQNMYVFWNDPADGQTRLVYVDTETAAGTTVGQPMGNGHVTGATAALISGNPQWLSPNADMLPIAGQLSINPNNSPDNEFTLQTADGSNYTRDDLHSMADVDTDGYLVHGGSTTIAATNVRVKPKGSGSQNEVTVGGVEYEIHNSVTYLFTGQFQVKVWNDHINGAGKAMGKWHLIFVGGNVEAEEGADDDDLTDDEDQWLIFALQNVENEEDETVDFDITDDSVVPTEEFAVKVSVLGAAITYGGSYNIPVTSRIKIAGASYEPFGDFDLALDGDVNDDNNPRHFVSEGTFPAGTAVSVLGRSWLKKKSNYKGNKNHHWKTYLTVDGASYDSQQLIVLRNGDPVPDISGYLNQEDAVDFVRDFIDDATDTMVLDENQAIFLYELGTTNIHSAAADFQDLVVLVTLAKTPDDLEDGDDDDSSDGAAARLLKVDHKTGGYEQIMTLDNTYDSLAWLNANVFYAMQANELWLIDPEAQTETLVDPVTYDNYFGLEFAGSVLMGFEVDGDYLNAIDHEIGMDFDDYMSLGMSNLGTIVFMPAEKDPSLVADAFD